MEKIMHLPPTPGTRQKGATLLEALIGILMFSVGILALVGMQALAIKQMTDAKYRSDAGFFSNEIIGHMWVNRGSLASYDFNGTGTPPAVLGSWVTSIQNGLPGVTATANLPIIAIAGTTVTVTVRWQVPGGSGAHRHITMAYING
jgi:type IV pilus assembly protein PilV